MADNQYDMDPELLVEFLDESDDLLNTTANLFITLEEKPQDKEAIDTIFRTVHTIKGNSAFFNLMKVKSLAHRMEDLMNLVREGKLFYNTDISNVLIRGIDVLKEMMARVRKGQSEAADESALETLVGQIESVAKGEAKTEAGGLGADLKVEIDAFARIFKSENDEINQAWQKIFTKFSQLFAPSGDKDKVVTPSVIDHRVVIEDILSDTETDIDAEKSAKILAALKELKTNVTDETLPLIEEALKTYDAVVPTSGFTGLLKDVVLEKIRQVELKPDKKETAAAGAAKDHEHVAGGEEGKALGGGKTMRVSEASIDVFLDFIGELVVVGEMYDHIQKRLGQELGVSKTVADLKKNNESFNDLSLALQKSLLDIRRVPIKTMLSRAPRLARDVANAQGKQIKVAMKGDELLIDKSRMETLDGPFVHMLRNAADHGIEKPEVRQKKGKPVEGNIWIEVRENEEEMFITIRDDGAGINVEAVKNKAVKQGMMSKDEVDRLPVEKIYLLLFEPGFSTAEQVTDISGRGVGMDVVKKSIEAIGGKILIESVPDKGSSFTLQFPKAVCVKIMDGFLVSACGQRFILPMSSIGESFEILEEKITHTPGQGDYVMHHSKIFPVRRLSQALGLTDNNVSSDGKVGVTVEVGQRYVLLVDKVLGAQRVVIKDIVGLGARSQAVAGASILGDERVAIVLDVEKL